MNSILSKVVDNYAGMLSEGNEGSVREIFEHYAAKSIENQSCRASCACGLLLA